MVSQAKTYGKLVFFGGAFDDYFFEKLLGRFSISFVSFKHGL